MREGGRMRGKEGGKERRNGEWGERVVTGRME